MMAYEKYKQYLKNVGGPITTEVFDTDWEPIGPMIRQQMIIDGITYESDGKIELK